MNKILRKITFLIVYVAAFSILQIYGQLAGNPANFCRNGFFPRESSEYKIAQIKGKKGERVYFYGDERDDCPQNKNCRLQSYVIPNDEVIVSRTFGDFACVWFQPRKGSETVGWIPAANLVYQPEKNFALTDWLGAWSHGTSGIDITPAAAREMLLVKGDSYWQGLGDNVHVSEIEETVAPRENILKIGEKDEGEDDCRVTMRRVGKYMIVADNLNCGGVNVTFSGVYRRKTTK